MGTHTEAVASTLEPLDEVILPSGTKGYVRRQTGTMVAYETLDGECGLVHRDSIWATGQRLGGEPVAR